MPPARGSQRPDTYDSSKDSLYDTPFTKLQPVGADSGGGLRGDKMADDICSGLFLFSLSPSLSLILATNTNFFVNEREALQTQ